MSGLPRSENAARVAIVGGGLAGMAAAAALGSAGVAVELFEAKKQLGGRAGSFFDAESGEWIDHCQHVALGCCTNFFDFCRRTGIFDLLKREPTLHFFGQDGRRHDFRAMNWLPAPLHLAPALLRLRYLTVGQRLRIMRTMLRLRTTSPVDSRESPTIGEWLRQQGESDFSIEHFWSVVLVSALSETVDKASLPAARKVFVDGFMAARSAHKMYLPSVSLRELYHVRVGDWLRRVAAVHLETPIASIRTAHATFCGKKFLLVGKDGVERAYSAVIAAVPWRQIRNLFADATSPTVPGLAAAEGIVSSSISGVHLWLDRPIMDVAHAVLIGRLAQWVFAKVEPPPVAASAPARNSWYYQVVISASGDAAANDREELIRRVREDLQAVFPRAREAVLLRARAVTDPHAVFSTRPGLDEIRPEQSTEIPGLLVAGDWTRTGWPATMEGAVRSGYLAAEKALEFLGTPQRFLVPDLAR